MFENRVAPSSRPGPNAWTIVAVIMLVVALAPLAAAQSPATDKASATCANEQRRPPFTIEAYNANITTHPRPAGLKRGQIVEFNPDSLADPAGYLREIARRGGLPEWYWVGVNCNKGPDCNALRSAGVGLGSTGTAEWNKTEQRIQDLRHPAAIARTEKEMARALRAAAKAGSGLMFRIDNMHNLDDDRFYDRRHVRTDEEVRALTDAWDRVVRSVRASGALRPSALVGLTGHNNFAFWERHLAEGGTPPLVLRIENPTQFTTELEIGLRIMAKSAIPLLAVEFRKGHKYRPTEAGIREIAAKVSLLALMENEDNYEDGTQMPGPGPKAIVGGPRRPECAEPR